MRLLLFWILYITLLYLPEIHDHIESVSFNGAASSSNEIVDDSISPESDSFEVNPDILNEGKFFCVQLFYFKKII